MRLSALAVIAAGAALVTAAPVPIRLLIISSSVKEISPPTGVRFGHAVPPLPVPEAEKHSDEIAFHEGPIPVPAVKGVPAAPPRRFRHRPGCGGMKRKGVRFMHKFKLKALEISNAFRQAFGLPLIEIKHHQGEGALSDRIRVEGGLVTILPHIGTEELKDLGGPAHHEEPDQRHSHDHMDDKGHHRHPHPHHHHHHHHHHHDRHGRPFLSRLHFSLMNLGRWEGRAVAFVIGCGIGVLLRMFWVLAVVSFRTVRGPRAGYVPVSTSIMEESDDETVVSAKSPKADLPKYLYLVDEKIVVEETK